MTSIYVREKDTSMEEDDVKLHEDSWSSPTLVEKSQKCFPSNLDNQFFGVIHTVELYYSTPENRTIRSQTWEKLETVAFSLNCW